MPGKHGYAGKILAVDLSSKKITDIPTIVYADNFIGGMGIAVKIYWDGVAPEVNALSEDNLLVFITGPLAGLHGISGSRWAIYGKSPESNPARFSWCNLGGSWGAYLKFAGYDGIIVRGKSDKPVYLLIRNSIAELKDAASLWGRTTIETRDRLKSEWGKKTRVVSTGPAGDNLVSMASVLADEDSSGCGLGAVMGSKKLKAIAVTGGDYKPSVANEGSLNEIVKQLHSYHLDKSLKFISLPPWPVSEGILKKQVCYGCISGCVRETYASSDGERGKFFCQSAGYYKKFALDYYGKWNDVTFYANRLCDKYGLDTKAVEAIVIWLSKCYEANILTDKDVDMPISKIGSLEFIETLVKKISLREGIGDLLAEGIYVAAKSLGNKAEKMITDYVYKAGQTASYSERIYTTHGILYAMQPRQPIQQLHETIIPAMKWRTWLNSSKDGGGGYMSGELFRAIAKRFWGSELAVDFSTYAGKALAAKKIQDRECAKECLILCDRVWPILDLEHSEDHLGDSSLESKIYSAVTGHAMDEEALYRVGEMVFNFQRAILLREGHKGREDDRPAEFNYTIPIEGDAMNPECLVPGKNGAPISKKNAVVDREDFEKILDEYYRHRRWQVSTGFPTKQVLEELQLKEIIKELEQRRLITNDLNDK